MADISIRIKTDDEASKIIVKITDSMEDMGRKGARASDSLLKSFSDFTTGLNQGLEIAQKVGAAMKDAFDFAREGAVISQTAASFDLLMEKAGMTTDLLEQLRRASNGTVDDMTLMSSTMTLVAGTTGNLQTALLEATPQLLEIAKAASKLNPSLGDTAKLYQDIATGVKRAQPLILDNLGLTISVGDANKAYAEILGKSVEALTEEEKQMALLNDTIRAGKIMIEQAGGAADSAVDSYDRLTVATQELGNAAKIAANDGFAPLIEGITETILWYEKNATSSKILNKALEEGMVTQAEFTKIGYQALFNTKEYDKAINLLTLRFELLNSTAPKTIDFFATYAPEALKAAAATDELAESVDGIVINTEALKAALSGTLDKEFKKLADMRAAYADLADPMKDGAKLAQDIADATENINDKLMDMTARVGVLALLDSGLAGAAQAAWNLARDMGLVDETTYNANVTMANLNDYLKNTGDVDGYAAAVAYLGDNLERLKDRTFTITQINEFIEKRISFDMYQRQQQGVATGSGQVFYEEYASGTDGWRTVPPGFPNDSYGIGLSSGEQFAVIPSSGSTGGAAMGSVVINITESSNARDTAREVVRALKLQGAMV